MVGPWSRTQSGLLGDVAKTALMTCSGSSDERRVASVFVTTLGLAAYLITLSAMARTPGGTVRPSVIADCGDELKFGRKHHRKVGGFFGFENTVGIGAGLAEHVRAFVLRRPGALFRYR